MRYVLYDREYKMTSKCWREVKWSNVFLLSKQFSWLSSAQASHWKIIVLPKGGGTFVPLFVKRRSDPRRRSTSENFAVHRLSRSYQFCTIPLNNVYSETSACRFRLPTHRVLIRIFTRNQKKKSRFFKYLLVAYAILKSNSLACLP